MKTAENVQENAGDILAEAKQINEERAQAKEAAVQEDLDEEDLCEEPTAEEAQAE